jgi:hypothetical protein
MLSLRSYFDNYLVILWAVRIKDNPFTIRAQDAFGIGDFYIEIAIVPKSSDFIKCVSLIHATNDWHQLSMERIS